MKILIKVLRFISWASMAAMAAACGYKFGYPAAIAVAAAMFGGWTLRDAQRVEQKEDAMVYLMMPKDGAMMQVTFADIGTKKMITAVTTAIVCMIKCAESACGMELKGRIIQMINTAFDAEASGELEPLDIRKVD